MISIRGKQNLITTQKTSLRSLRTIEKLPIDYGEDVFAHYPGLKLGLQESVDYFGPQLAQLAEDFITQSPEPTDWVITGPAYNVLPGAPNLLCPHIHEHLKARLPPSNTLSLVPLREETGNLEIKNWESLNRYHNYSTFTQDQRNQIYANSRDLFMDQRDFQGRSILFVNDIRVTGTHQRYMEQALAKVNPPQICWLYILTIDPKIAAAQPELEYAINHSRLATFEEFAELLATRKLLYTSRCITRLLSYELDELVKLFQMLDAGRKQAILELALAEGRFSGEYFKDKIDLLRR